MNKSVSRNVVASLIAVLVAFSGQAAIGGQVVLAAQAEPGTYELSFFRIGTSGLEPVTSLPVLSDELILGVHVEDQSGLPAQRGMVMFQYCSLKGFPPNDINRADEAPSQNCEDGSAKWANLGSASVDASGNAYMNFGLVAIPRVVGFRCRYNGQGSGIANGLCAPMDFTWTPAT